MWGRKRSVKNSTLVAIQNEGWGEGRSSTLKAKVYADGKRLNARSIEIDVEPDLVQKFDYLMTDAQHKSLGTCQLCELGRFDYYEICMDGQTVTVLHLLRPSEYPLRISVDDLLKTFDEN